jgi:hypothetical protein
MTLLWGRAGGFDHLGPFFDFGGDEFAEILRSVLVVRDREGQALAYVYFEEESGRQSAERLLSKGDAWRVDRERASKLVGPVAPGVIRIRHSGAFRNACSRRL